MLAPPSSHTTVRTGAYTAVQAARFNSWYIVRRLRSPHSWVLLPQHLLHQCRGLWSDVVLGRRGRLTLVPRAPAASGRRIPWALGHLSPTFCDYFGHRDFGIGPGLLVWAFGCCGSLIRPRLTAAFLGPHLAVRSCPLWRGGSSPRVRRVTFAPVPPHIRTAVPDDFGFEDRRLLAHGSTPEMRFVFLGSGFCLQLPSDPTSRWAPLLFG